MAEFSHNALLQLVVVVFGHEEEMNCNVAKNANNKTYAEATSSLGFRHKVTEAHNVIHEEDARAFIESLHAIREFRVHWLKVNQVDHHEDREKVLDRKLHPKKLNDYYNCKAETGPAEQEN